MVRAGVVPYATVQSVLWRVSLASDILLYSVISHLVDTGKIHFASY